MRHLCWRLYMATGSIMSRQQGWKQRQFPSRRWDTDLRESLVWKQVTLHQVSSNLVTLISTSSAVLWCDDAFRPAASVGVSIHKEVDMHIEHRELQRGEGAISNATLEDKYHVIATVDGGLYTEWCGILHCCQFTSHGPHWAFSASC